VVLLVIVGFVALLLSTAHLPVVNQRGLCIILAKINLQAQTTFLVKRPSSLTCLVLNLRRARTCAAETAVWELPLRTGYQSAQ
jgi:hypothetical protein